MKNSIIRILLAVVMSVGLWACNEETDWYGANSYPVGQNFGDSLRSRYPDAQYVAWNLKDDYLVASFRVDGFETDAWFNVVACWVMTVSEISYKALPTAISERENKISVDDIFRIERPYFAQLYMIKHDQSVVIYTSQGLLVTEGKNIPDAYPVELPAVVIKYLEKAYPDGYLILEATYYNSVWSLRVLVDTEIKEIQIKTEL